MDMIPPQVHIREDAQKCGCLFDCLVPVTRVWGVFTAVVLCGVGVDLVVHQHITGIYLIISSAIVFWLEIVWAVTLFLQLCVRSDRPTFWRCWDGVLWVGGWKKALLYAAMAGAPLGWPGRLWLSYVAGGQLLALAVLHLALSCRGKRRRRRKDHLLRVSDADSYDSNRFEEVTEVLDDSLPEPMPGSSHSLSDSLVEQEAVLEI